MLYGKIFVNHQDSNDTLNYLEIEKVILKQIVVLTETNARTFYR